MITDTFLTNMAKAINSESYDVVSHLAVTSDTSFEESTSATNIGTEIGSRISTGNTRSGTTVTFNAIKTGALTASSGETLTGIGYFESSSGDGLHVNIALPNLNQTQGFDIEFDLEITPQRRL